MINDSFKFYVPAKVEKSVTNPDTDSDNSYVIAGWASTPDRDFEGEQIDPAGIDDSYFKENGWIDYEHDTEDIIGLPTANCFTDATNGFFVEARLFKGNPKVERLMQLVRDIKSVGSDRKIGFSIEGQISERDSDNPTIIKKVQITGVAVTTNPANGEATWDVVQKSRFGALEAGYEVNPTAQVDGGALKAETVASHITSLAYVLSKFEDPKKLQVLGEQVAEKLDARDYKSSEVEPLLLQVFSGISRKQAKDILSKQEEKY